jgi:AmiR/NasT family two-component response regulator
VVQRVFIVWTYPLFRETVSLLLEHPGLTVVGVESDRTEAQTQVTHLKPDIIIIEETANGEPIDTDIIGLLDTSAWEPRIVRLSLQDNELRLYRREQRTIETREDLLTLFQDSRA